MFLREKEFKALKILGKNFLKRFFEGTRAEKRCCKGRELVNFLLNDGNKPSKGYAVFDNMIDAWECRFDEWVMRPRWLRVKEWTRIMQESHGLSEMT